MKNVVLLFHSTDDRGLLSLKDLGNVGPELFEPALRGLKEEFDIIGLDELTTNISHPSRGRERLLSVTFDDGPKSYITKALPVMESLGIPSACFLVTDCTGDRRLYWRYLYNYCIHSGRGKGLAALVGRVYGATVGEEQLISFTRRHFSRQKNEAVMAGILRGIVTEEEYREKERDLFLSRADLASLKRHDLVTLGIHTKSHPVMAGLCNDEIRDEISGSIDFYRREVGEGVPAFSVPFGRLYKDYDERTIAAARDLSVEVVLSAYGGDNPEGQPLYNVRRIPVQEEVLREGFSSFMTYLEERCSAGDYVMEEARLRSALPRGRAALNSPGFPATP
jgi:peptidoglycan/xylan/chitin deacetylase (PgdA/CDA1 family)